GGSDLRRSTEPRASSNPSAHPETEYLGGTKIMTDTIPKWQRGAGWVRSGILALPFLPSPFFKIAQPSGFAEEWSKNYPVSAALPLGVIELTMFVLYLIPKTRYLGGLVMPAYLGGAVATHVHTKDGMFFVPVIV